MTLGEVQLLNMGDHSVIVIGDEYLDDEGNLHPLSELPSRYPVSKGDVLGHKFHGNQYEQVATEGVGGKSRVEGNAQTLLNSLSIQKRLKKDFDGTAGQLKENICKDIAQRFGDKWDKQLGLTSPQGREEAVSQLIAQWAHTSNNSDPMSLAIQEAAVKEFGITSVQNWKVDEKTQAKIDDILGEKGEMLQAFLRAQYDATQEYFKSAGIKEVTLYRGFKDGDGELSKVEEGSSTEIPLRPLSSFTSNYRIATTFGETIISGTIPVERLLSCYGTGVGCKGENELVVLGGDGQWQVNGQMNLEGADLANADLSSAYLGSANLNGADLSLANLNGAYLTNANLTGANLYRANLTNAYLTSANLTNAYLGVANLGQATLTSANLSGVDLSNANLTSANLNSANLMGATLMGATLTSANLRWANLGGANLYQANLYQADLPNANLNGATLVGANLTSANLSGAYLGGANLNYANLNGAYLGGADLTDAYLTNANLGGANLNGANLDGANGSDRTVLPEGSKWKVENNKIVPK